jgi:hypothetical protein
MAMRSAQKAAQTRFDISKQVPVSEILQYGRQVMINILSRWDDRTRHVQYDVGRITWCGLWDIPVLRF